MSLIDAVSGPLVRSATSSLLGGDESGGGSGNLVTASQYRMESLYRNFPSLPKGTGSGNTHPSLIDLGAGNSWNSYRYWMAYTPYPSEPDENPFIVASNDRETWVEPGTNPIEPSPPGSSWNADTDIFFSADGLTLHCVFIQTNGDNVDVCMMSSTDGVNWSAKTILLSDNRIASPSVTLNGSAFQMTYLRYGDTDQSPTTLHRRTSTDLVTWTAEEDLTYTIEGTHEGWHLECRYVSSIGRYVLFLAAKAIAAPSTQTDRFYILLSADGLDFGIAERLLIDGQSGAWSRDRLYRMTGVPNARGFDVLYGGGNGGNWEIGDAFIVRQTSPAITGLLDQYVTSAQGGFSLSRHLTNAWRDMPLAFVRRASDDAHELLYLNGAGQLVLSDGSTLASTWLDTTTGHLAIWFDQTGRHGNLLQDTPAAQPSIRFNAMNGKPTAVFSGAQYMASHDYIDVFAAGNFIAAVVNMTAGQDGTIWSSGRAARYLGHSLGTQFFLLINSSNLNVADQQTGPQQISARAEAGTDASFIRRDGEDIVRGTLTEVGETDFNVIGARYGGSSYDLFFTGEIAEILFAPAGVTDFADLEQNQMEAFGLFTAPGQIENLTITPSNGQLIVSYDDPLNDGNSPITSRTVQFRENGTTEWTTFSTDSTPLDGETITGVVNGTSYDVQVFATNANGDGVPAVDLDNTPTATPTNLAVNGDFATGDTTGWHLNVVNAGLGSVVGNEWQGGRSGGDQTQIGQNFPTTIGVQYTVEVDISCSRADRPALRISNTASAFNEDYGGQTLPSGTATETMTRTFTATTEETFVGFIFLGNVTVTIDNLVFYAG